MHRANRSLAWVLAALVSLWCGAGAALAGELLVIAHPETQETGLDKATLKSLLLGNKQKWDDGTKVVIVMPKASDDLEAFLKDAVGKTAGQFDMYWKRLVFTGKGLLPKTADTPDQAVAQVRMTRGAIALVPTGTGTQGVKVLAVTP